MCLHRSGLFPANILFRSERSFSGLTSGPDNIVCRLFAPTEGIPSGQRDGTLRRIASIAKEHDENPIKYADPGVASNHGNGNVTADGRPPPGSVSTLNYIALKS